MVYHLPLAACGTQLFELYRIAIYFQVYLSSPPRTPKGMPLKTEPHPTLPCIVHLNSACTEAEDTKHGLKFVSAYR